jgi:hypothetical protein
VQGKNFALRRRPGRTARHRDRLDVKRRRNMAVMVGYDTDNANTKRPVETRILWRSHLAAGSEIIGPALIARGASWALKIPA